MSIMESDDKQSNEGAFNLNINEELNDSYINKKTNNELVKTYSSDTKLYGISFQNSNKLTLAVSSIETTTANKIEILEYNTKTDRLIRTASETTEYPSTKIMWTPDINNPNLLASTSDQLRIYKYSSDTNKLSFVNSLVNNKQNSPLTSMDWNRDNNALVAVCSIDTTCAIWDLNNKSIETQLIAHDKEVYDIAFGKGGNTFISSSADGSIRLFDLRDLENCEVLFDTNMSDQGAITRIAWNQIDNNFIGALVQDRNFIIIVDIRVPEKPYAFLNYHTNVVNGISWTPKSNSFIASVGDDKNALIWDIHDKNRTGEPLMSYSGDIEFDNLAFSEQNGDWMGVTSGNTLQMLKIK